MTSMGPRKPRPQPKVAIVGAGTAGISAALKLIGNGIDDVIVLEAQDYIGGRVKSVLIDGKPADLGAQFIHGRVGNPLYDVAARLNRIPAHRSVNSREESLFNPSQLFCLSSGKKIDMKEVQSLVDILEDIDLDSKDDGTPAYPEQGGPSMQNAIDVAYREFLESRTDDVTTERREIYDAVVRWYSKYIQIDNASEDLTTLTQYSDYHVLPGDRFHDVENGMAGILTTMAGQLPEGVVRLNTPVTHINWGNQTPTDQCPPVNVTCADGVTLRVDHVIVTSSLGCLQANHSQLFTPPLPDPNRQAIENSGFGAIGKIYLLFGEEFWDTEKQFESFEFLWLDSHTPDIKTDHCPHKTRTGKPWWHGFHSCETVYALPKVLEIWLSHDQLEICESLSDQEVMTVTTEVLRAFLPHLSVPDPVAIYRTHWLSNPFTRGTYSYPSSKMSQEDQKHLGQPLPSVQEPRLMFAGEGYSKHFSSTVHGALTTGDHTADQLLAHYGLKPQVPLIDLIAHKSEL